MKYSEASQGRIFVIRLEDGDIVHEAIESFAAEKKIQAGALIIIGGADKTSRLVVGPEMEGLFTLFAILFVFVGIQILGVGLLGEYVGRIYREVRNRPRFVISETRD